MERIIKVCPDLWLPGGGAVPTRILLLSADFGSGHLAAATAIAAACRSLSADCEAVVVQCRSPLLGLVGRAYLWQIRHTPDLYRQLYRLPPGRPLRRLVIRVLSGPVRRALQQYNPDVVVGTHPFPAGAALHLLNRSWPKRVPVVMALTDFAPHGFWIWPGVARYFTASEQAARELVRRGADAAAVRATGIPVRMALAADGTGADRTAGPTAGSSSSGVRRVLVIGGGLGLGPIAAAVDALLSLPRPDLRVTVICGRNEALLDQIRRRHGSDARLTALGFTDQVLDHMREADLLVTKPGGITCAEALALGLPMLLLDPLPGPEEENAAYLAGSGAARVVGVKRLAGAADDLLFRRPERLAAMAAAARQAGHPASALAIAAEVLALADAPRAQVAGITPSS
ncbi:putative UDP-glucuronosyltransferase [Symbiobacterium thermophilum IAM 14863]|nr:putative UDP-glucuronosyltransferase [Symbiobacterium thermophilum IAM 14863]